MSMKDRNYWIERAKDKVIWNEEQTNDAVKELMFFYDEAANEIEDRILAMYQKYAEDNNLTAAHARQLISGKEYSVWKKSLEEYLAELSGDAANSKTALELNTLAMKSRISREEKLLADVYRKMAEMAGDCETDLEALLSDIITTNYERSCYNLQVGIGVGFEVGKVSDPVIKNLLDYPWAQKKFSKAVWDDVDAICAHARREITRGFIAGSSVQKMTKEINDVFDKGKYVVERLVRTECKYFANQGELLSYKENGITKYVFMGGTEGSISCDCAFYNNKIIDVDKAVAGVNFPPLHPNCLCSIRAYFEKGLFEDKDCVPLDGDISMKDWKEKFLFEKEEQIMKSLEKSLKNPIMKVDKVTAIAEPNAKTIKFLKNGQDVNFYDSMGRMSKQISNHNHGNPKTHPYGKNGEHAHDIVWKNGKAERKTRELTPNERKELKPIL